MACSFPHHLHSHPVVAFGFGLFAQVWVVADYVEPDLPEAWVAGYLVLLAVLRHPVVAVDVVYQSPVPVAPPELALLAVVGVRVVALACFAVVQAVLPVLAQPGVVLAASAVLVWAVPALAAGCPAYLLRIEGHLASAVVAAAHHLPLVLHLTLHSGCHLSHPVSSFCCFFPATLSSTAQRHLQNLHQAAFPTCSPWFLTPQVAAHRPSVRPYSF